MSDHTADVIWALTDYYCGMIRYTQVPEREQHAQRIRVTVLPDDLGEPTPPLACPECANPLRLRCMRCSWEFGAKEEPEDLMCAICGRNPCVC